MFLIREFLHYTDLRLKARWEITRISRIQAAVQDIIFETWKHLLEFDEERLTPEKLQEYADVINAKIPGGALPNCWGLEDWRGTTRQGSQLYNSSFGEKNPILEKGIHSQSVAVQLPS